MYRRNGQLWTLATQRWENYEESREAQAKAAEEIIYELEESAALSEGREIDFLYTEADGGQKRGKANRPK